jgi:hypothetical protein
MGGGQPGSNNLKSAYFMLARSPRQRGFPTVGVACSSDWLGGIRFVAVNTSEWLLRVPLQTLASVGRNASSIRHVSHPQATD